MAESPFPLQITEKQDSYEKVQLLQHMDPSLYLTAAELNGMIRGLNFLYDNIVTGGYTGNIPANFKYITINHQAPGTALSKMITAINAMPTMTLQNGALQWFYNSRFVTGSDASADLYEVITDYYLLNRKVDPQGGVSSIGAGGTKLTPENIILLHRSDTRSLAPQVFNLGDIGAATITSVINSGIPRSTPNTATIIFRATQNNEAKSWMYIGAQEMVGTGYPGITNDDLQEFPTDPNQADPAPPTPIFQYFRTIPEMLTAQAQQNTESIILVTDASADPSLTFPQGETKLQAYYKYNGIATGSLDDYTLISAPYAQADGTIKTENTADISLTGDGTDANKLKATLQPTPNSTDIFGRTDDHWQPVVRDREEDGVRWVEVLSPNGEKLLQYATEYFNEVFQSWRPSRNTLLNISFDVKTLKGQSYVNALGYVAALASEGDNINALGSRAAQGSSGSTINALGSSAARDSQGDNINALGNNAAQNSQGDNINAIGVEAGRHSKGDDVNVFGRDSYSLLENPKCDRVNIFGPEIQPTKSDQNIISGEEFLMPSSTAATVMAGGPKSLTTLETVEEMIGNTQGFTTQIIDTGGNYNDLEVTADLLVFTNENAQAILNGIWGRKEFHILNLSSQYEILINHDSSSVSGNGQPIMLPTNSGTAGIKGTARVLQTDSYGYFVADTWGSKYRPEFAELTEDKVMLVGADHRAKAEDIIELKFYRTNQSTAMDSAELENDYPESIQGTEVICTPINKKYEKINNLGDWIEIDFATV